MEIGHGDTFKRERPIAPRVEAETTLVLERDITDADATSGLNSDIAIRSLLTETDLAVIINQRSPHLVVLPLGRHFDADLVTNVASPAYRSRSSRVEIGIFLKGGSRLHVQAQRVCPVHLLPVEFGHLLFDPGTEGLHMRMLPPALCANEVISAAGSQRNRNRYHELPSV